jgi:hypothetical protein
MYGAIVILCVSIKEGEIFTGLLCVILYMLIVYHPFLFLTRYYIFNVYIENEILYVHYSNFNRKNVLKENLKDIVVICDNKSSFGSFRKIQLRKKISKYDSKKILTQYCYLDWAKEENINALKKMIEDAQSHKE